MCLWVSLTLFLGRINWTWKVFSRRNHTFQQQLKHNPSRGKALVVWPAHQDSSQVSYTDSTASTAKSSAESGMQIPQPSNVNWRAAVPPGILQLFSPRSGPLDYPALWTELLCSQSLRHAYTSFGLSIWYHVSQYRNPLIYNLSICSALLKTS